MPDFEVIDGGGNRPDDKITLARQALETLIIELLRALARDDDYSHRVTRALVEFANNAPDGPTQLSRLINGTIFDLHKVALSFDRNGEAAINETTDIVVRSLRVAAESMASDNAAGGRYGSRVRSLQSSIEEYLQGHEMRSREHGWSYVSRLIRDI